MTDLSTLSRDQLIALVQQSQAAAQRSLTLKVTVPKENKDGSMSKGGAISVYGLGRFPVTLYRGQWERLSAFIKDGAIDAFIEANAAQLSVKA